MDTYISDLIGVIVVIVVIFVILNKLELSTTEIMLYEMFVLSILALSVVIDYFYFIICVIILSIMLYFKIRSS